ncbi:LolA family protein [Desulforhopalus singaporensis]|uniref:Outer membrane lipoprotein carrier protein n=1 Tax=Desulforhopalus singaporensis TaxID=91360 RepID=A0A1H0TH94_9BACT|nr:outer membrane lipoprotein carrier protein LolA [Desulforhopalus singaporensis]SDP52948.1 outer membrane lipoprotein carrier protein [Desulforhopalus singaporensis]
MNKAILFFVVFFVITTIPFNVQASAPDGEFPEDIAARVQSRYDRMASLSFAFHQETVGEITGRNQKGSGHAFFLKDNSAPKMRWNYELPNRQVLLGDGKLFSMYFENLQQMIVTPAENLDTDLTYSFFTGKGRLLHDFHIRPPDNGIDHTKQADIAIIKLIPVIPQSQVQDIHLFVSADSLIRRISIKDHFGTVTTINISDIEVNALAKSSSAELDKIFSFIPPEGTEIIRQ